MLDQVAVLVDEHRFAKLQLLDRVGMNREGLGAPGRSHTGRAEHIDLSGMLDRVLGADHLDHGGDIFGGVETLDQIAIAAGKHLTDEVIRPIGATKAALGFFGAFLLAIQARHSFSSS